MRVSTTAVQGSDADTYRISTAAGDQASTQNKNYNVTFSDAGQLTINKRAVTVSFDNKTKQIEYGDVIDLGDYKVSGVDANFKKGDLVGSLQTTLKMLQLPPLKKHALKLPN